MLLPLAISRLSESSDPPLDTKLPFTKLSDPPFNKLSDAAAANDDARAIDQAECEVCTISDAKLPIQSPSFDDDTEG